MTKTHIPLTLVFALLSAILLTIGISTANENFYIAAVWSFVLFLVLGGAVLLGVYKKLVNRLRVANERLAELRFLVERRYELSRERLDTLLEASNDVLSYSHKHGPNRVAANNLAGKAEFDNLVSRLQRIERRIVGRLENELLSNDRQVQQIDELMQILKDANLHPGVTK